MENIKIDLTYEYIGKAACDTVWKLSRFPSAILLVRNKKLCPIEVKSSGYKNHKSFDMFAGKYQAKVQERYMICAKDLSVEENIIRIPLYMTMCL